MYDNVTIGFADRSRILGDRQTTRTSMFAGPDADYGSVLVDGFVSAVYKTGDDGLTIQPFRPLTTKELRAVEAEGARLLEFVGIATSRIRFV